MTEAMTEPNMTKLTDLLEKSNTPYIKLTIKTVNGEKCKQSILDGTPTGWKQWSYDKCMQYNKTRTSCKHLQVNLSKSPYMVIDNDEVSVDNEFRKTFGNEWMTSSISKGLCHVWMKKDENDSSKDLTDAYSNDKEMLDMCPYFIKTDLRYSNIFERADAMIKITPEMPVFQFETEHPKPICKNKSVEKKTEKTYDSNNNATNVEMMIKLGLLDNKIKSYSDWFNVLCAFKRSGLSYELFDVLSSRDMTDYDENKNRIIWEDTDVSVPGYNMGSIIIWCKEKDEELYNLKFGWFIPITLLDKNIYAVAQHTHKKFKNLIFCNEKWYKYNESLKIWQLWKDPTSYVASILNKYLDFTIAYYANKVVDEADEDKKKELRCILKVCNLHRKLMCESKYTSQFIKLLKEMLYDRDFEDNLDNLKYKLAFRNGMYYIKTGCFREGLRYDDFLTDFINVDYYEDVDEEKEKFIYNVFYHICNGDKEQADYYKSVLGSALCGDAEKEKDIYFVIGQGANNGKTTILEAMKDAMPSVVGSINNQALLNNYTKAHKFLPVLGQKKIVYVEELLKGKELNTGLLKEIRDGKSLSNEVMYGTSKQINVSAKMFILSNHLPVFKTDNGISTCLRQIQCNTKFCTENNPEYHKVGVVPGYMKADKTLADKLRNEYLIPLIQHLLKYARMYVADEKLKPIPKFFLEKARETCMANDEMQSFWDDEIVENPEYKLSKAELEHHFKKLDMKEVQAYFKTRGYEYQRDLRSGDWKRGGWKGITLSQLLDENEDDE